MSHYVLAGLLPVLVLAAEILAFVSNRDSDVAIELIGWLGIEGTAATLVSESIEHAERTRVTSSVVGVTGLVWAALAVTGALRRVVDAVWGEADVGWTARFRSVPWAVAAGMLVVLTTGDEERSRPGAAAPGQSGLRPLWRHRLCSGRAGWTARRVLVAAVGHGRGRRGHARPGTGGDRWTSNRRPIADIDAMIIVSGVALLAS